MFQLLFLAFATQIDLVFTQKNDLKYKLTTEKSFTMDVPYDCNRITVKGKKCGMDCCRMSVNKGLEFTVKQPQLELLSNEISQNQQQITIFRSIIPPISIDIKSIKVTVKTNGKIVNAIPKHTLQSDTKIAFDLVKDSDFLIQFENSKYGPVIEQYTRKVYVEQYAGVLNVFNSYILTNKGSKLDYFNRADYMRQRQQVDKIPVVQDILFTVPGGAQQPWVRDEVGNITTSNFRNGRAQRIDLESGKAITSKSSSLRIKPRYPVFGGWKFDFGFGYFESSASHMLTGTYEELYKLLKKPVEIEKTNTNSPNYFYVSFNLGDFPKSLTTEKFKLEIVLPEGAHHIHVQANVDSIMIDQIREFSYFDAMGRRKLIMTMSYVQQDQIIKVLYAQSPFDLKFRKLLTVSLGLLGLFTTIIAISRIDLSLKINK
eukprot:NODE_538_length_6985_cov_0.287892.p2 type:complete len:429 gc:universal NODE_538_length_6985_cov_0.287892:5187-6473(+)